MFESKSVVLVVAGLGFFALAFLVMGLFPWAKYNDRPEISVTELAEEGMTHEFIQLAERFRQASWTWLNGDLGHRADKGPVAGTSHGPLMILPRDGGHHGRVHCDDVGCKGRHCPDGREDDQGADQPIFDRRGSGLVPEEM